MRLILSGLVMMLLGGAAVADETPEGMTPKEIADGWIKLFDGETTFGWSVDGPAKIENGVLVVGGDKLATLKTTNRFGSFEFRAIERATVGNSKIKWETAALPINESSKWTKASGELNGPGAAEITLSVPAGSIVEIRELALHPKEMKSLFNGTDLMGWR